MGHAQLLTGSADPLRRHQPTRSSRPPSGSRGIVRLNRLNRLELMSPTRLAPDMLDADKSSLETGSFQRCFHEQANN
jgi:hypothetical protein